MSNHNLAVNLRQQAENLNRQAAVLDHIDVSDKYIVIAQTDENISSISNRTSIQDTFQMVFAILRKVTEQLSVEERAAAQALLKHEVNLFEPIFTPATVEEAPQISEEGSA